MALAKQINRGGKFVLTGETVRVTAKRDGRPRQAYDVKTTTYVQRGKVYDRTGKR